MTPSIDPARLERARTDAVPASLLAALSAAGIDGYLVGGAVRDALMGADRGEPDVDIAIEGDVESLLGELGAESRNHDRFGTAAVELEGRAVDIAETRRESYARPGALPDVAPAPIRTDLARRDFTVNAMAIPLLGEAELIDPYDGQADLERRTLRAIHPGSFVDDPTRALRCARYAARLGLVPDAGTHELLLATDLGTVSADRVTAEIVRTAEEDVAVRAFRLIDEWGLLAIGSERLSLLAEAAEYLRTDPWSRIVPRATVLATILTADDALLRATAELASQPGPGEGAAPSRLFELASRYNDVELAIARAMGAEWLDLHVSEWRRVELRIDGRSLSEAGVPEGPAIGAGLRAALHARIDGSVDADAGSELAVAMTAARAAVADSAEREGDPGALA
jgi:tRNA nucleotidyltransferase (CCA-adding enzyme)